MNGLDLRMNGLFHYFKVGHVPLVIRDCREYKEI